MAEKYEIDGYVFLNKEDFDRAKKEKETIAYISAKTDMTDMKAVYKIYRIAAEKKSFQTIFGLEYMKDLRNRLSDSGIVTEEMLEPVPVGKVLIQKITSRQDLNKSGILPAEKAEGEIEKLKFRNLVKNVVIAVLAAAVGVMLFVTYQSKYSIFTYFTDYEQKIRDEIADEYMEWQEELEKREEAVSEKEGKNYE